MSDINKDIQVYNVLVYVLNDITAGRWNRGARFGKDGGRCLMGSIDERTNWTIPGVREEVMGNILRETPLMYRIIAKISPGMAIALFNDTQRRTRVAEAVGSAIINITKESARPRLHSYTSNQLAKV